MTQPPFPPFPRAVDPDTEPGLGLLALKAECRRLREERDAARLELANTPSSPPTKTRGQKTVATLLAGTKYAGLLALAGFVARLIAKKWPESQDLVEGILQALGL